MSETEAREIIRRSRKPELDQFISTLGVDIKAEFALWYGETYGCMEEIAQELQEPVSEDEEKRVRQEEWRSYERMKL